MQLTAPQSFHQHAMQSSQPALLWMRFCKKKTSFMLSTPNPSCSPVADTPNSWRRKKKSSRTSHVPLAHASSVHSLNINLNWGRERHVPPFCTTVGTLAKSPSGTLNIELTLQGRTFQRGKFVVTSVWSISRGLFLKLTDWLIFYGSGCANGKQSVCRVLRVVNV